MWRQLQQALTQTRTIELRLDWLRDDAEIARFIARLGGAENPRASLIATCRRPHQQLSLIDFDLSE
jgi:hypothetical protein